MESCCGEKVKKDLSQIVEDINWQIVDDINWQIVENINWQG